MYWPVLRNRKSYSQQCAAILVLGVYAATVLVHDAFHNRESKTRALWFGGDVWLERLLKDLHRKATALILNAHLCILTSMVFATSGGNLDAGFRLLTGLDGIFDEVVQHLSNPIWIKFHAREVVAKNQFNVIGATVELANVANESSPTLQARAPPHHAATPTFPRTCP